MTESEPDHARIIGDCETVRAVFEDAPVMLMAVEGPRLTIVAANSAYRTVVGRPDLIGRDLADVFPELAGQGVHEVFERAHTRGEPQALRGWRAQLDVWGEDRYFDVVVAPRTDVDGAAIGLTLVALETTDAVRERLAAQHRAAESDQRLEQSHDVPHSLQRELLPPGLPVLPGVQVAAGYLLAEADNAAGGDWFDAVTLPDGRLALIVGDVVGHGVTASAVMGQLRVVLADRLEVTGDLAGAMRAADRWARRLPAAHAATVCVAVLDPADGSLTYCTAGHPPPLVVSGGVGRFLRPTGGVPLATSARFPLEHDRLRVGDVILLYSDGLLERPHRDLSESSVELLQVTADVVADRALPAPGGFSTVERVVAVTPEMLIRTGGYTDDITLLAAQRTPPVPMFSLQCPAALDRLVEVRRRFGAWMEEAFVDPTDAHALQHAVGEPVANAVEHAYPDADGTGFVSVTAALERDGNLRVTVVDAGRWREPAETPYRGRGLTMASRLVDDVVVDHTGIGTAVTIRHRLSRPVRLLTAEEAGVGQPAARPDDAGPFLVLDQPTAPRKRIRVDGPIDSSTARDLDDEITRASAAGTRELTVDLTGVTHLGSAGVAVLYTVSARADANRAPLRLYAPPGTCAEAIMTLVGLPHSAEDPDRRLS